MFNSIVLKIVLISFALLLQTLAWTHYPYFGVIERSFGFVEIFLHEVGHASAGILTGGSTSHITLGGHGGATYTHGGNRYAILFSGYFFPPVIGTILYVALNRSFNSVIRLIPYFWIGFTLICGLLWVRDMLTLVFMLMIWVIFRALSQIKSMAQVKGFLQFVSIFLIISGFTSTYETFDFYLLGAKSDIARLSSLAGITSRKLVEIYWWCTSFLCLICLYSDYLSLYKMPLIENLDDYKQRKK